MIFTSYTYLLFLAAAFLLHWSLPKPFRNALLIVLSYAFYCSWKWQFGFLLLAVSIFTWSFGALLARRDGSRGLLALGITVELLPLVYYKYAGFLATNATALVSVFGSRWHARVPDVLLPLGISFFTFQGIAYLVDIATASRRSGAATISFCTRPFGPSLSPARSSGRTRFGSRSPQTGKSSTRISRKAPSAFSMASSRKRS
jgi:D-alanyl-lipoteichoic acid acyltransferase DltB (MBOAT superfamily)